MIGRVMHQSIPSDNTPPQAIPGVLHLLSAQVPGFVPSECLGSDLLSIIKVPSYQLMPHEGTFQFQTDLPSALLLQSLLQSWGKLQNFKYGT